MMRLGSVILKVAPRQVADRMWYFPLLKPYVDHVPVKGRLVRSWKKRFDGVVTMTTSASRLD